MKNIKNFRSVEKDVSGSGQRYRRIFESSEDGIMILDFQTGRVMEVNPAFLNLFGDGSEAFLGKALYEIRCFREINEKRELIKKLLEKGHFRRESVSITTHSGRQAVVDLSGIVYEAGSRKEIRLNFHDITDRIKMINAGLEWACQAGLGAEIGKILVQQKDLKSLLQLCTEAIVKYLDAAFARIWILNPEKNTLDLMASAGMYTHIDGGHKSIPVGRYKIGLIAETKTPHLSNDIIGDPFINDPEWAKREGMVAFAGHPIIISGRIVGVMAMFAKKPLTEMCIISLGSISDEIALGIERLKSEEKINFLAYYDHLTRLPNRYLFTELVNKAIDYANRYKHKFAAIYIDLDDFNRINDTLGPNVGDQLLRIVSERLQGVLRKSDVVARLSEEENPIARMGGDEFIVLLHDIEDVGNATHTAQRILDELSRPYECNGLEMFITACIGISIYPEDGIDVEMLVRNADAALHFAKKRGKNNFQFYSKSMNEAAFELLTLESDLRRAIERNELMLFYQPKIDLQTLEICGMEALIRWKTPEGRMIPPGKFIPLAESNGLIGPISRFVLQTACFQNKKWQDAGFKKLCVAINVSGLEFGQRDFMEGILSTLEETGLDPQYLELEITETTVMIDPERAVRNLSRLKQIGVRISLDDFGTGYSSLSYLQRLPLDTVKIDISFIRNVVTHPGDAMIVKTIIAMAHNLNLKVIAEGIEEQGQLAFLRAHHCDALQGYLFSPAVAPEEFERLLIGKGSFIPPCRTEQKL